MSDRTFTVVVAVITTVWAGNIIAGMFQLHGYQPSESINGIFMGTVGLAFISRRKKGDGDDE